MLAYFTVNVGRKFRDSSWCPLNRGCPLNTGFTVFKNRPQTFCSVFICHLTQFGGAICSQAMEFYATLYQKTDLASLNHESISYMMNCFLVKRFGKRKSSFVLECRVNLRSSLVSPIITGQPGQVSQSVPHTVKVCKDVKFN